MGGAKPSHKFFRTRRPLDVYGGLDDLGVELAEYVNVPATIGAVISSGKASLAEMSTVLGLEDVYDILEVITVDTHNRELIEEAIKARRAREAGNAGG